MSSLCVRNVPEPPEACETGRESENSILNVSGVNKF